jgi:Fe-S cluster assembly protein SufD
LKKKDTTGLNKSNGKINMALQDKNLEQYIANFKLLEDRLNGQKNGPVHDLRKVAFNHLLDTGFPTTREEEWRFTDIKPLLSNNFTLVQPKSETKLTRADIDHLLFKDWKGPQLVFVDGYYRHELSSPEIKQKGIVLNSLGNMMKIDEKALLDTFAGYEVFSENAFSALNTAFINDGMVLKIEKNVVADQPIHFLYIATENEQAQFLNPRNLVHVAENSQAEIVESHYGLTENQYFNNAVTEIRLEENAYLKHIRVQNESTSAFHMCSVFVDQKANSHYFSTSISFGGKITRNNIYTRLLGEGVETILNGLYMGHGSQHIDNNTYIDHVKPHCNSHELYQGILTDKAHGVFGGKIMVHPEAQKTDAKQSNNCLLLSDDAEINTKPQLEIYADDVRCTHGATIGQLDEESIFYLQSRGISEQRARNILTYAFAGQVVEGITIDAVREHVDNIILNRLQEDMNFIK